MLTTTKAVVLKIVPYSDSKNIFNCYSPDFGRITFVHFQSKGGKRQRSAYFHPLSLVEVVFNHHERKHVYTANSMQHSVQLQSLLTNPLKQSIILFLAEWLNSILKDEDANAFLYTYISDFVELLNVAKSNFELFHLKFILELATFTGFFPEMRWEDFTVGGYLNLYSGDFESQASNLTVSGPITEALLQIGTLPYDKLSEQNFPSAVRTEMLDEILRFYALHFPDFKVPASIKIFRGY